MPSINDDLNRLFEWTYNWGLNDIKYMPNIWSVTANITYKIIRGFFVVVVVLKDLGMFSTDRA